jgi:hypothetical protein
VFCAPEQPVQRKEFVQIVKRYIADHSETSNERTVALVWLALAQAFPCNKLKAENEPVTNHAERVVAAGMPEVYLDSHLRDRYAGTV